MSKNQFTGTATQPQRNRIFRQFNKDQYCSPTLFREKQKELRTQNPKLFFLLQTYVHVYRPIVKISKSHNSIKMSQGFFQASLTTVPY